MTRVFLLGPALAAAVACGGSPAPATEPTPTAAEASAETTVVSSDILAREPVSNRTQVKHILISWQDKADAFQGGIDPRAAPRSHADAEAVVRDLVARIAAGEDFDALMQASSEDTGSAATGRPFTVTPDAGLVIEFRQLGLRLSVDEVGVVESDFGFHIMKRVE
jgi:peptidyl-prolyl cis-trans isomerase D